MSRVIDCIDIVLDLAKFKNDIIKEFLLCIIYYMYTMTDIFDAIRNDKNKLESLFRAGKSPNVRRGHETALMHASTYGITGAVKLLLKYGARVNEKTAYGTALNSAASFCHVNIIKELLKAGANTEAKDIQGNTAIFIAARSAKYSKCRESLKLLLDNGARIDIVNKAGDTVFDVTNAVTADFIRKYTRLLANRKYNAARNVVYAIRKNNIKKKKTCPSQRMFPIEIARLVASFTVGK